MRADCKSRPDVAATSEMVTRSRRSRRSDADLDEKSAYLVPSLGSDRVKKGCWLDEPGGACKRSQGGEGGKGGGLRLGLEQPNPLMVVLRTSGYA